MAKNRRALTRADKEAVFSKATSALPKWFASQIALGMTDTELESALKLILGMFGGSCGPDRLCITFQGSGLKIWGSWHIQNHVTEKPLFAGKATIAMARHVYGIADPSDHQLQLL